MNHLTIWTPIDERCCGAGIVGLCKLPDNAKFELARHMEYIIQKYIIELQKEWERLDWTIAHALPIRISTHFPISATFSVN